MSARKPKDVDEEPWTRRDGVAGLCRARAPSEDGRVAARDSVGTHGDAGSGGGVRADGFRGVGNADGVGRAGDDTDEYGEEPAWVGGEEVERCAKPKTRHASAGLAPRPLAFLRSHAARASASLRRSSASSRSSSESSASVSSASVSRESPSTPDPASRDRGWMIFGRGAMDEEDRRVVAVVGQRRHVRRGRRRRHGGGFERRGAQGMDQVAEVATEGDGR